MTATLLAISLLLPAAEARVALVDGSQLAGELLTLDGSGLELRAGEQSRRASLDQVARVEWAKPDAAPPRAELWLELRDGSTTPLESFALASGRASVALSDRPAFQLDGRQARSVRFRDHSDQPALAEQWRELYGRPASGDLLVVRKTVADDSGAEQLVLTFLEGVVREINETTVRFEFDGEPIEAPRAKVEGVIFYQPAAELPEPVCQVSDARGGRWSAVAIRLVERGDLLVETAAGVSVTLSADELREADFTGGKVTPLSELPWEVVSRDSYFDLGAADALEAELFRPRFDRAYDGRPLSLAGREYATGLALYSRTKIAFRLPEGARRLLAVAGVDDRGGGDGHVRLLIEGDGRTLAEHALSAGGAAVEIDLDLSGARRLTITADYGDDRDIHDQLNLCEARISK